jgi:hypothetical protein
MFHDSRPLIADGCGYEPMTKHSKSPLPDGMISRARCAHGANESSAFALVNRLFC